ncbi:hypothetical protein [Parasitella parasitica]|uniref:Uncharacterized protein n=1 Tax=Parasitella parasitica TaxID=35722 RepID=A0A0B7N401_9FUNG|nr:hypothetical protein [Parasitella parasitica]
MVAFEKEPLTIRIFPCSLNLPIEAIFRGITYHLQAFGVVEAHSSTKKLNYVPLQIEGEVEEEIEEEIEEKDAAAKKINKKSGFINLVKKLICNMSKTNATQATDASEKVEMARNEQRRLQVRIHEMEDSFNVLQIKRDKLKLRADKSKVVQQAFEAADEELKLAQEKVKPVKEELEAAKKDCVKAEDEEYNTWVKHVSEIDANGLINGAKVSTKPLIIVTPIYDDIKKTGLYETTAVNYTKIVAIDFGTDESKIVVYEKIEDEWLNLSLPIEAIFRGITYHLQAFGVLEAHSSTKKLNYVPLQIEGEVEEEIEEEIEEKDEAAKKTNKKSGFINRFRKIF